MRTQPVCRICLYSADRDASIDPNRRRSGARCSEFEIERDPLTPVLAARAPQSRRVGGAAIFPRVVSGRSFLLWPCRSGISSPGGSRPLTPASGAWLFPDRQAKIRGRPADLSLSFLSPLGGEAR